MWRSALLFVLAALAAALAGAAGPEPLPGACPQPRFTQVAPPEFLARQNTLGNTPEAVASGELLFSRKSPAGSCVLCHGPQGDGRGVLASQFEPRPRNFRCSATVNGVPDGQLFWIIRHGSPGTAMPPFRDLGDEQIWQIVSYLRSIAAK